MVRDNELLEERRRLMETLNGLLDAINHASVEQRSAINALVSSSAAMLERVGAEFTDKVGAESARMIDVASQMTTSAVEVASLGEAFGHAVQCFAESNDKLVANLQRLEGSLGAQEHGPQRRAAGLLLRGPGPGNHRPQHHVPEAHRR